MEKNSEQRILINAIEDQSAGQRGGEKQVEERGQGLRSEDEKVGAGTSP